MRIGVAGIMSGKTLIAKKIAQKYGLPLIKDSTYDTARILEIKNFSDLLKNKDYAKEYQVKLLIALLTAKQDKDLFVSDLTVYDLLAHWCVYGLNDSSPLDKMYCSKVGKCAELYDLVILTKTTVSNKFPHTDFIHKIEKELWKMLITRKLHPKVAIAGGKGDHQLESVMKAVEVLKNQKLSTGAQVINA